ncbi:MAG TPA: hypothetical protein VN030_01175 [Cellvibrio sp.]|nr:hypothetical protein [Cellvibrio sp.]
MQITVAIISGIITAILLFPVIFKSREDLVECLKFWIKLDIISLFKGEYLDEKVAELRLVVWVAASLGVGFGVYLRS